MTALIQSARPGLMLGERPERRPVEDNTAFDRRVETWFKRLRHPPLNMRRFQSTLNQVELVEQQLCELDDAARAAHIRALKRQLRHQGLTTEFAIRTFATIRVMAHETLQLKPHPEQLFGGWVMLHGAIAEMHTGEGKTLTAALPAIAVALTGTPVHVVTVNEYLVERDAHKLAVLYKSFGLRVATVTEQMSEEDRRQAYRADVVYCTNKQLVFDYLRDLQVLDGERAGLKSQIRTLLSANPAAPVMRGLSFAIVDEADSVLVDDARIPLILAQPRHAERAAETEAAVALSIARTLHEGVDFRLQPSSRSVRLTEIGLDALRNLAGRLKGIWRFERYRDELIRQALTVLHLYRMDRDYLVRDGKVELIDESTGRVMPDRKLQHGLHRMLEVKERCRVSEESEVIATLSFQRFFNRYCHLAGMSGTVKEVRNELSEVYGVSVIKVPTHKPSQRTTLPPLVVRDRTEQLYQMLEEVVSRNAAGQPVLIGTRTVEMSERVSDLLHASKIPHELLNARQDADEAEIVGLAGNPSAVTVATNMAGRGTDIPLRGSAALRGGLHVINLEINESRRVDRQLSGRSARQGDPGSCQDIFSLKDELVASAIPEKVVSFLAGVSRPGSTLGQWFMHLIVRYAQQRRERLHTSQRMAVFNGDEQLKRQLAISGDRDVNG